MLPIYFKALAGLAALALVSQIPSFVTYGFWLAVLPGLALWLSNTALVYGLALAPSVLLVNRPGMVVPAVALGVAMCALVAVAPAHYGEREFRAFAATAHANDFAGPAIASPRRFDVPAEWRGIGAASKWGEYEVYQPECSDLCQDLLFGGHAEAVFASKTFELLVEPVQLDGYGPGHQWPRSNSPRAPKTFHGLFRIEKRGVCPKPLMIAVKYQARIDGGECLIEQSVSANAADVRIDVVKLRDDEYKQFERCAPGGAFARWRLNSIGPVVEIHERRGSGMTLAERRTGLSAYVPPTPFFFSVDGCDTMFGSPTAASVIMTEQSADLKEILSRRYGISFKGGRS